MPCTGQEEIEGYLSSLSMDIAFSALVRTDTAAFAEFVIYREIFAYRSLGTEHRTDTTSIAFILVDKRTENAPGSGLSTSTRHRAADGKTRR